VGQVVINNEATANGDDGFNLFDCGCVATDNRLESNRSINNAKDGFDVDQGQGNALLRNLASGNGAEGFDNSGDDTLLVSNIAQRNRLACANDGSFDPLSRGNNFNLTVCDNTPPEIEVADRAKVRQGIQEARKEVRTSTAKVWTQVAESRPARGR
jgi:parallel beta-helix repeat protein